MYADYRELLEKEKNLDAVKIITPDHLHGLFSMAAIKRGKHVMVHKPLSNRLTRRKETHSDGAEQQSDHPSDSLGL